MRIDRRSGAWLLERFITKAKEALIKEAAIDDDRKYECLNDEINIEGYIEASKEDLDLTADKWRRALTVVKRFPKGIGGDAKEKVYRIEQGYGWVKHSGSPQREQNDESPFVKLNHWIKNSVRGDNTTLRIVVVNDDASIFRRLETNCKIITKLVELNGCWLILSTANPLDIPSENPLWGAICNITKENPRLYERIAVVVSSSVLRSHGFNISELRAIETCAIDLVQHIHPNSVLHKLLKCQHVLIRDRDVVFHFDKAVTERFHYYFRPFSGRPESNPNGFGMAGYGKILVASIVKEMIFDQIQASSTSSSNISDWQYS